MSVPLIASVSPFFRIPPGGPCRRARQTPSGLTCARQRRWTRPRPRKRRLWCEVRRIASRRRIRPPRRRRRERRRAAAQARTQVPTLTLIPAAMKSSGPRRPSRRRPRWRRARWPLPWAPRPTPSGCSRCCSGPSSSPTTLLCPCALPGSGACMTSWSVTTVTRHDRSRCCRRLRWRPCSRSSPSRCSSDSATLLSSAASCRSRLPPTASRQCST
mmetsp:Transcript_44749/g.122029  ORF Transcript_44749/g.122029 Transcript_44749/m.122029 type:complete len:215 (+) Transcript_44749:151-795(+)